MMILGYARPTRLGWRGATRLRLANQGRRLVSRLPRGRPVRGGPRTSIRAVILTRPLRARRPRRRGEGPRRRAGRPPRPEYCRSSSVLSLLLPPPPGAPPPLPARRSSAALRPTLPVARGPSAVKPRTRRRSALLATKNGDEGSRAPTAAAVDAPARARDGTTSRVPRDAPTLLSMPGRDAGPHRTVPVPSGPLPLAVGIGRWHWHSRSSRYSSTGPFWTRQAGGASPGRWSNRPRCRYKMGRPLEAR